MFNVFDIFYNLYNFVFFNYIYIYSVYILDGQVHG